MSSPWHATRTVRCLMNPENGLGRKVVRHPVDDERRIILRVADPDGVLHQTTDLNGICFLCRADIDRLFMASKGVTSPLHGMQHPPLLPRSEDVGARPQTLTTGTVSRMAKLTEPQLPPF